MVLVAVFLLIAVRQVGRFTLKIWQIMLGGALAVLITGQIGPVDALRAINPDVILFLFGMFIVGEALVESGYLAYIAHRFFSHAKNPDQLVLVILFGMGLLSALLMNDTLAIIGTPLVLALAMRFKISPTLLLLTLAIAITTGSVMSPMGNPQNLLIAQDSGMTGAFMTFGSYLLIPTLINLLIAFVVLRLFYPEEFASRLLVHDSISPYNRKMTMPVRCSLVIIFLLAAANIVTSLLGARMVITLPLIALAAALPVLLLSGQRWTILRGIDWATLVFFAAMFVVMESVWQTGFFQSFVDGSMVSSVPMILGTSVLISQFISNVPFVALFQPMIIEAGAGTTAPLMALAAGSTIAGNLTILGAASNVIIIQNAEKQGQTISFIEFAKVGVPLTILQITVYWIFLSGI
ncbi:MAG: SLC13 family permease [Methanoregula sp.]|nr:SLC13 family permease [Methanoregula sp.]